MALPQTACLALGGPLAVPFAGRAWFPAFDDDGDLIEVLIATRHSDNDSFHHLLVLILLEAARWCAAVSWLLAKFFALSVQVRACKQSHTQTRL